MTEPASGLRLLRIATILFAFLASYLVYENTEPGVEIARSQLDDVEVRLRADEALFAARLPLESAERTFAHRYRSAFAPNGQAAFVRDLEADARRHGVVVLSSSFTPEQSERPVQPERFSAFLPPSAIASAAPKFSDRFTSTRVLIGLRGSYRSLLGTIGGLSTGSQIVSVDVPGLRRDGDAVVATVPLRLLHPNPNAPRSAPSSTP